MGTIDPVYLFAALGLAAALLERSPRRLASLGVVAGVLGCASLAVGAGANTLAKLGTLESSRIPVASLAVDAGFIVLGLVLVGTAGTTAIRRRPARGAIVLAAAVALAVATLPVIVAAGAVRAIAAAAALGAGSAAASVAIRAAWRRLRTPLAPGGRGTMQEPIAVSTQISVLVAAIAGPHVSIVFLAAVVATLVSGAHAGRVPVRPLLVACVLLPTYWALHTIAGPVGLGMGTLADAPLSTAAQLLITIPLTAAAASLFGLWPFQLRADPLLVPVGAAILLRVGAALPDGIVHWQPILIPLGVVAIWHGVATARRIEVVAAGAWIACAIAAPEPARIPASAGAALLSAAVPLIHLGTRPGRVAARVFRAGWMLAAAGAVLALEPALESQVMYAVAAVAGVAALIASGPESRDRATEWGLAAGQLSQAERPDAVIAAARDQGSLIRSAP